MSKKVASIFDKSDNQEGEQDAGQAFYAGGSEHSGQQILGPSRGGNFIQDLINDARRNTEQATEASGSSQPLTVTLWRNGFTVGDGELRAYDCAENREFIECLRRGDVPPELSSRVQGGMIDIKLDTRDTQDYESSGQRFQVFTGEGRRLGAVVPEVISGQQQQEQPQQVEAKQGPTIDEIRQARLARFSQKSKDEK